MYACLHGLLAGLTLLSVSKCIVSLSLSVRESPAPMCQLKRQQLFVTKPRRFRILWITNRTEASVKDSAGFMNSRVTGAARIYYRAFGYTEDRWQDEYIGGSEPT